MTQRNATTEILKGIGTLFLCHLALTGTAMLLSFLLYAVPYALGGFLGIALYGIGLSQLIYAIPLGLRFKKQRRFNAMKGVIIGAVITLFLNGSCFVLFLWAFSKGG